jgi:tetratricopeptide (TPR) repeat protein
LAVATAKRNQVWRNEITLWEDVTAKSPNNPRSWNNLGYAYLKYHEPYKALAPLLRSVELNPSHPDAWNNLGMALDQLGRYKGRFQRTSEMFANPKALESTVMTAWFGKVYNNAGLACEILGRYRQAAKYYQESIAMNPGFAEAYYNLGLLYLAAGNRPQAELQLQMLSFVNPGLAAQLQQQLTAR